MALTESVESHYQVMDKDGKTIDVVSTLNEANKISNHSKWLDNGNIYINAANKMTFHGFGGDGLHS